MSTLSPFYEPVARDEYLERLEIVERSDELSEHVWDEVHELVQADLAKLDAAVQKRVPTARIQVARTAGQGFFLFTYRTFSQSADLVDPVVVGITFTPSGDGIGIEADASGEQSGDPIVTLPPRKVRSSRAEVIQAALDFTGQLRRSHDRIAAALVDPSRDTK